MPTTLYTAYDEERDTQIPDSLTTARHKLKITPCFVKKQNVLKVQASDLAGLERAVRHATQKRDYYNGHHDNRASKNPGSNNRRPGTAGSGGGPSHRASVASFSHSGYVDGLRGRSGSPRATTGFARAVEGSKTEVSRRKQRPSTAGSATSSRRGQRQKGGQLTLAPSRRGNGDSWDGDTIVPLNVKNEWLILETYHQLKMDEKQSEEDRRAREGRGRRQRRSVRLVGILAL